MNTVSTTVIDGQPLFTQDKEALTVTDESPLQPGSKVIKSQKSAHIELKNRIYEIDSIDGENSDEVSPMREGEDLLAVNTHHVISSKANLDQIMSDSLLQKRP